MLQKQLSIMTKYVIKVVVSQSLSALQAFVIDNTPWLRQAPTVLSLLAPF
jgi:hypothetical protein